MAKSAYLSRKLLNQLKTLESDSGDMLLTYDLHNLALNGKKVGCSGHIANATNGKSSVSRLTSLRSVSK